MKRERKVSGVKLNLEWDRKCVFFKCLNGSEQMALWVLGCWPGPSHHTLHLAMHLVSGGYQQKKVFTHTLFAV